MKVLKWRILAALLAVLTVCLSGFTACDIFPTEPETTVEDATEEPTEEPTEELTEELTDDNDGCSSGLDIYTVWSMHEPAKNIVGGIGNCTDTVIVIPAKGTFPNEYPVEAIGVDAFAGCTSITGVILPDGMTHIELMAFSGCTGLAEITITASLTNIGLKAFYECESLTDVYYSGTKEQWQTINIDPQGNETLLSATIHCTDGDITPEQ